MMDGLSDRGAIQPLSDLRSIEPVLTRNETDQRPTPAEEGEPGSFDSRGERGDSAELSREGIQRAARETAAPAEDVASSERGEVDGTTPELEEGRSPEETIQNMERARREALAPPNPTLDELQVATKARRMADEARTERRTEDGEAPVEAKKAADSYAAAGRGRRDDGSVSLLA